MRWNQEDIKIYIAVGIAIIIFVPFMFGSQIFSRIFPFSFFQGAFLNSGSTTSDDPAISAEIPDSRSGDRGATTNLLDQLGGLSDPVTILDLELGEGTVAETSKTVSVGYIGTRFDPDTGEEVIFDQNLNKEAPFSFILGSGMVIPGFDQGVTGMRIGGKRLVIIQPEMGYGDQQVGDIPPNTTLQFMIELYEVKE